jgi:hypothetical protein
MNRNLGYVTRQVRYFFDKQGHAFVLVFVAETVAVTALAQLRLVDREDFVGLAHYTAGAVNAAAKWGGIVPRIEGDGASYVSGCATVEDAAEAVRAEARALRAEADRVASDPAYALEQLLKSHDWFAHYSDDYGVCAASDRHWEKIQELRAKIAPEVYEALLAKYQPEVK